VKGIEPSC